MNSNQRSPAYPAHHVQAAIAAAQAKPMAGRLPAGAPSPGDQALQAHMQRAVQVAQARTPAPAGGSAPAAHVERAVQVAQARTLASPGGFVPPPHVQRAVQAAQARTQASPGGLAPAHFAQAVGAAAQARSVAPPVNGSHGSARSAHVEIGVSAAQGGPTILQTKSAQPPGQSAPRGAGGETDPRPRPATQGPVSSAAAQAKVGFEYELGYIKTQTVKSRRPVTWKAHHRGQVIKKKPGYEITADRGPNQTSQLEFIIDPVNEDSPADCRRAIAASREILRDIQDLAKPQTVGQWVPGQRTRLNTSRSHRFMAEFPMRKQIGQLQATAGLSISRLPEIVSGRAVQDRRLRGRSVLQILGNYNSKNVQPIWHHALAEARLRHSTWTAQQQEILASAVSIVAQVPLAFHGQLPGGQSLFTAKTDFSRVMSEVFSALGHSISRKSFEGMVMSTINKTIRQGLKPNATLNATDDIFAPGTRHNNVPMSGLSIRQWLRNMVPKKTGRQGVDLFTPAHFPGTKRQRDELRGFGRMGNRVDAGRRPLFEFRNLATVYPADLPNAIGGMLEYIRVANNPEPSRLPRYAMGAIATGLALYGLYSWMSS